MTRHSLATVTVFALAFAVTGSAEVVRSHKGKAKNQAQTVPVATVSFSPSGSGLTAVTPASEIRAKHRGSTDPSSVPLLSVAPVVNTVSASPNSGKHNTSTPVTGVSPYSSP